MLIVYGSSPCSNFSKSHGLLATHNMAFRSLASTPIIFSQHSISLSFSQPHISYILFQVPPPHIYLLHNSAAQLVACNPKTFHATCLLLSILYSMHTFPVCNMRFAQFINNFQHTNLYTGVTATCLSIAKGAQSLPLRAIFFGPSSCAVHKHY
jgi:hypothetical protein